MKNEEENRNLHQENWDIILLYIRGVNHRTKSKKLNWKTENKKNWIFFFFCRQYSISSVFGSKIENWTEPNLYYYIPIMPLLICCKCKNTHVQCAAFPHKPKHFALTFHSLCISKCRTSPLPSTLISTSHIQHRKRLSVLNFTLRLSGIPPLSPHSLIDSSFFSSSCQQWLMKVT